MGTDNLRSIGLMTDYLCRSGEPPCYFGMPLVNANAHTRRAAYTAAMTRFGRQPRYVELPDART